MKRESKHSDDISENPILSLNVKWDEESAFYETNKKFQKNDRKTAHKKITHNYMGHNSKVLIILIILTIIAFGNASLCDIYPNAGPQGDESFCNCNEEQTVAGQYIFTYINGPGCEIDCSMFYNVKSNQALTTTTCDCVDNYTWQDQEGNYSCIPQCEHLNNTDPDNLVAYQITSEQAGTIDPYAAGQYACNCRAGYIWQLDQGIGLCISDCAGKGGSKTIYECNCNATHSYDPVTALCELDCSKVNNSNGVYDADTDSCGCNLHYQWVSPQCVINCSVPNSNGPNQAGDGCGCIDGFTWNNATFSCEGSSDPCSIFPNVGPGESDPCACDDAQIGPFAVFYYDFSKSSCWIDCPSFYNTQITEGPTSTTCTCVTGYTMSTDAGNYNCIPPCSTMEFAVQSQPAHQVTSGQATIIGSAQFEGSYACTCQLGYSWNIVDSAGLCKLNCDGKGGPLDDTHCNCNATHSYDPVTALCELDCSKVNNSNGVYDADTDSCGCNLHYQWVSPQCVINCSVPNSNGPNQAGDGCGCIDGFTWNNATFSCEGSSDPCSIFPNVGPGESDPCACDDAQIGPFAVFYYDFSKSSCWIDCPSFYNTQITEGPTSTTCTCVTGYTMSTDAGNYNCIPPCSTMEFAVQSQPAHQVTSGQATIIGSAQFEGSYACTCQLGYSWNIVDSAGLCKLNCDGKGGPLDDTHCNCNATHSYDPVTALCELDCSKVNNSNGVYDADTDSCGCNLHYQWVSPQCVINCSVPNSNGPNQAGDGCGCIDGFTWNNATFSCESSLDCSTVNFSTGQLETPSSCQCYSLYKWNSSTSTCDIDCAQIQNADTSPSAAVPPTGQCTCIQKFYFDPYIPQCVINCSQVANSVLVNVNTSACRCKTKYNWVSTNFSCVLDCSATNVPNSVGPSADGSQCTCKNSTIYNWVALTSQCRLNCTEITNSLGILNSTSSCRCKPSSSWSSSLLTCKLVCGTVQNNNGTVDDTTCACKDGYYWDPSAYLCLPTTV